MRWVDAARGARRTVQKIAALAGALALMPGAVTAAGFGLPEQGARAAGMAGAVVARAEEPTALFHNPGAVALLGDEAPWLSAGLVWVSLGGASYRGQAPGIGAGVSAEQEERDELLPHLFVVRKVGSGLRLGFGIYSPFRLETGWELQGGFPGRYSTIRASLEVLDIQAGVSKALGAGLGVGLGVIYRTSELSHHSRLSTFDPLVGAVVDAADQRIDGSRESGVGFSAGVLHRPSPGLSWGASYRSAIEIDYSGTATLSAIATGNPQLDDLLAATLPFEEGLALESRIELPDALTIGVALHPNPLATFELDASLEGWSSIQRLPLSFVNDPYLDREVFLVLSDTTSYRLGASLEQPSGNVYRAGLSLEESPLPDEALGAFWVDGDRTGYYLGVSRGRLDLAVSWIDVEERRTTTSREGLNGSYRGDSLRFSVTYNR